MESKVYFAQKGIVLDKKRKKILLIRYSEAKYTSDKIGGKLGLPGGKMDFGENPDNSFIREVKEETGVTIKPGEPFYVYTWTYQRENEMVQIVALARLATYSNGTPHKETIEEKETKISEVKWVNTKEIKLKDFGPDERPVLKKFLKLKLN
jgi:mutator protein MutT